MLKPAVDGPPSPYASHPYRWGVLAAVWLVYSCFGLTTQTMGTLVKSITDDLGISYTKMGSILGAWPLVYIAMAIPLGAQQVRRPAVVNGRRYLHYDVFTDKPLAGNQLAVFTETAGLTAPAAGWT